jgi:hypothetical protein
MIAMLRIVWCGVGPADALKMTHASSARIVSAFKGLKCSSEASNAKITVQTKEFKMLQGSE